MRLHTDGNAGHRVALSDGKIGLTMFFPMSPSRRRGRHGRRSSETATLARIRDFLPVGWCESAITVAGTARRKVVTLSLRRRYKAHAMDTSARYVRARPWNSALEEKRPATSVFLARITVSCPCVGRPRAGPNSRAPYLAMTYVRRSPSAPQRRDFRLAGLREGWYQRPPADRAVRLDPCVGSQIGAWASLLANWGLVCLMVGIY